MLRLACLAFLFFSTALPTVHAGHKLIANEGNKLCVFDTDGKLEWEMKIKHGPHDLHLLPNGNLLTHQGTEIIEVDLKTKKTVWSFDAKKLAKAERIEVHSVNPIPGGNVMVAVSGEGKLFEINRDGEVQHTITMSIDKPHPHRDTRLVRRLENGNYLVAHEGDGVIREYDRDSQVVWEFAVPLFGKSPAGGHGPTAFGNQAFSAVRLKNGNTLIGTGNGHSILEVNHAKEIVWKLEQNDLEGITLAWVTTLEVHPNGHIVFGNCHAGPKNPQLIEIDREKKVHWTFTNHEALGNNVSNSQTFSDASVIR